MRRLSVAVLFVAGLALPVCAQRGGGAHGGGFSGHAAPAFRGGAGFASPRSSGAPLGIGGVGAYGARPGYSGYGGYRGGYRAYRGGGYYRGPVWGGAWLGAGYLGYPGYLGDFDDDDSSGYDDSAAGAAQVAPDYGTGYGGYSPDYGPAGPPPGYGPAGGYPAGPPPGYAAAVPSGSAAQGYRPAYPPVTPSATVVPVAPAADEDTVTLVFKDGRPPEHIHNYAMTRSTIYVQDGHHREIAIDDLDLPATEKANREAGVSFDVPQGGE